MFINQEHRIEAQASIRPNPPLLKENKGADADALRYNSLEFVYRPEFRQLVLLDQDPKTGEKISQVPSEYTLKLYAAANAGNISSERSDRIKKAGREVEVEKNAASDISANQSFSSGISSPPIGLEYTGAETANSAASVLTSVNIDITA